MPAFDQPLRPLRWMAPPPELLGASGTNRAPTSCLQLSVTNDLEALAAFLTEYDQSSGTHRLYQRECERLFLWAWRECGKPVSSLTRQDFEGYLNFLVDPQPAAVWCAPKAPQETDRWRPFVGPLGEPAVMAAVAAVNSMLSYWVDAGYLQGNPMGLIRQRRKKLRAEAPVGAQRPWQDDENSKVERFLDPEMWMAVTQALEAMPEDTPKQLDEKERMRFICAFLYLLAPRAGELERQRMDSFRESRGHWWWHVVGKGDKAARIPVPDDMVHALVRYRKHLGLPAVPTKKHEALEAQRPLLASLKDGSPITARRLNQLLKPLFAQAADLLPSEAEHKKDKLRRASAHWGRHTSVTARVDSGIDDRFVQKDARHADFRTTQRYVHEEDERWHAETQKLRLPSAPSASANPSMPTEEAVSDDTSH